MDKVLVVAYSRTGTSLRLARQLARPRGWPGERVEPWDLQLPRPAWAETAPHAAVHGEPL